MSSAIVTAEGLSKAYRLGSGAGTHDLREAIAGAARRVWRRKRPLPSRRREFWALEDVGFEVFEGEVFGIIGRNGAGKSTLLKILSRVTSPTRGEARIRGRVGSLLEVGTGFHPELSGRENTYLNGAILGMTKREIDARYESIVEYAGIPDFMDTPVKRYSSGMHVRLAFAIAAHLEPEVLILDEVLAVGDAEFQDKSRHTIQSYARGGHTILFVSHNMEAILSMCTRGMYLDNGRVAFVGDMREAVAQYSRSATGGHCGRLSAVPRDFDGLVPIIDKVSLLDLEDGPSPAAEAGRPFRLRIDLANEEVIRDPYVEFVVKDGLGSRIALVSSRVQQGSMAPIGPRGAVVFEVADVPLVPGGYSLTVEVGSGDRRVDFLPGAAELQIVWADVFGTGRLQGTGRGPVIIKARCQVCE